MAVSTPTRSALFVVESSSHARSPGSLREVPEHPGTYTEQTRHGGDEENPGDGRDNGSHRGVDHDGAGDDGKSKGPYA